jgi:hypothetical protein
MVKKRIYVPRAAKRGELKIVWGRPEPGETPDICYVWGDGVSRSDSRLLHTVLGCERFSPQLDGRYAALHSLFDELEERGYDLTTLKFSIQKKKKA